MSLSPVSRSSHTMVNSPFRISFRHVKNASNTLQAHWDFSMPCLCHVVPVCKNVKANVHSRHMGMYHRCVMGSFSASLTVKLIYGREKHLAILTALITKIMLEFVVDIHGGWWSLEKPITHHTSKEMSIIWRKQIPLINPWLLQNWMTW